MFEVGDEVRICVGALEGRKGVITRKQKRKAEPVYWVFRVETAKGSEGNYTDEELQPWNDFNEQRADAIGQNGNDGLHYAELTPAGQAKVDQINALPADESVRRLNDASPEEWTEASRKAMGLVDTGAQPAPTRNNEPAVWTLVMRDMTERDLFGAQKYTTRLQPNNGRDYLMDAYQEALDLVVYLRGAIYERDGR